MSRIALFIDGANLHATGKTIGIDIDFKKFRDHFGPDVIRAYYYTSIKQDDGTADFYDSIRPLIDWLDYNGYTVVTKMTKTFINADGRAKVKGNMDVEIVVDALELADRIDEAIIVSGDGDFVALVRALQRKGVKVTIVSTKDTQPPMVADELRRAADTFVDVCSIQAKIAREVKQDVRPIRSAYAK